MLGISKNILQFENNGWWYASWYDNHSRILVVKSEKNARTEISRKGIAQKRYFKICLKIAWKPIKKHVAAPFKLKGCLFNHHICQFLQIKMQKQQYLRVRTLAKKYHSKPENRTDNVRAFLKLWVGWIEIASHLL